MSLPGVIFQVCEKLETRCSVLKKRGVHQMGMWLYECCCGNSVISFDCSRFLLFLIDLPGTSDILCISLFSMLILFLFTYVFFFHWQVK